MLELFLKIILSLIVNNFIVFDSLGHHLKNLFVPFTFLVLKLDFVELVFERFNFVTALAFVLEELTLEDFKLLFFLLEQINFCFGLKFLLIDSVVFFSDCGKIFMGC